MQTLSIETTVKENKVVEIPIPFFAISKDEREWIGLLDEKTFVTIYCNDGLTMIKNSNIQESEHSRNELLYAWQNWHSCTESAFFEKYYQTIESISLHPKLAV